MTSRLRPSDGRVSPGREISLNSAGYRVGERVLFEGFLGWAIGDIEGVKPSAATVFGQVLDWSRIKGRVPAGCDEAALLEGLNEAQRVYEAAVAEDRRIRDATQRLLIRKAEIREARR